MVEVEDQVELPPAQRLGVLLRADPVRFGPRRHEPLGDVGQAVHFPGLRAPGGVLRQVPARRADALDAERVPAAPRLPGGRGRPAVMGPVGGPAERPRASPRPRGGGGRQRSRPPARAGGKETLPGAPWGWSRSETPASPAEPAGSCERRARGAGEGTHDSPPSYPASPANSASNSASQASDMENAARSPPTGGPGRGWCCGGGWDQRAVSRGLPHSPRHRPSPGHRGCKSAGTGAGRAPPGGHRSPREPLPPVLSIAAASCPTARAETARSDPRGGRRGCTGRPRGAVQRGGRPPRGDKGPPPRDRRVP